MIEQLFGSKTRVKLLQLFFSNPNRSYYVREITRKIDEQINSVRRELANLLSIGIISSNTNNNRLYYEVDQTYEYYTSLEAMFGSGVIKPTKKVPDGIIENSNLSAIGNIDLALYTGQFTRDERSGIDMLIVGDINNTKLSNFVSELESQEGKEIRYAVIPLGEYKYRIQVNDKFLSNVISSKMQILIDKHYLLSAKPKKSAKETSKETIEE